MDSSVLKVTTHTRVSQARSFRVPGYLIVEPRRRVTSLADLQPDERADLMNCLAEAEGWIRSLDPVERVYALRFGESDGAVHFHVVPRTNRILEAFLREHSEEPPYSGARIVDWLWFHQERVGYSEAEVMEWVKRAHALIEARGKLPLS